MLENQIVFNRDTRNKFAKIKHTTLSQLKNLSGVDIMKDK